MKGTIVVVTQAEFDEWIAKQKPAYYAAFPDMDPAGKAKPDSTGTKPVAQPTAQLKLK
jgi:cytochrome c oxidase subunit 2